MANLPVWVWIILVNTVVLGLLIYIWKMMEGRIKEIEAKGDRSVEKLLKDPLLTLVNHELLCSKKMEEIKAYIKNHTDVIAQKLEDGEERTALLIENAILKSFQNGRNGDKNSE